MQKKNVKYYVERFIDRNPLVRDGLYQQYINVTGLALILHPYIKSKLGDEVSFEAVKMALFRAGRNIGMPKKINIFKAKNIFIDKGINLVSIQEEKTIGKNLIKVKGKYLTSIWGKNQKTYIFDDFYKKEFIEKFDHEKEILSDLIIVGIKINEKIRNTKGVFYLASKNFYFYGVNVIQIIQTENEFSVVVEEKYLKDAVYAISNM